MNIEHLVLSGGAFIGLEQVGILNYLLSNGHIQRNKIKTIHCTSIGSWVATLFCLDVPFDIVKQYCRRPFETIQSFKITSDKILNIFNNMGIINSDIIKDFIGYLFDFKGLQHTITLRQFYEITKIDLYIYTTKLHGFEVVCFHHSTYPDVMLYDAIYMSSTLLPLMTPLMYNSNYYIDGGYIVNYPLIFSQKEGIDLDTILGIKLTSEKTNKQKVHTNMLDFIVQYLDESTSFNKKQYKQYDKIPYQIEIKCCLKDQMSIELFDDPNLRQSKIENGENIAKSFIHNITNALQNSI